MSYQSRYPRWLTPIVGLCIGLFTTTIFLSWLQPSAIAQPLIDNSQKLANTTTLAAPIQAAIMASSTIPLDTTASWFSSDGKQHYRLAWGDVDGDGDLDLAVGNQGFSSNVNPDNHIYLNEDGQLSTNPVWTAERSDFTQGIAWGDMDGDGDLDLAVANGIIIPDGGFGKVDYIYKNEGGMLQTTPVWTSTVSATSIDVAWGDINGDGYQDALFGGYEAEPHRLYLGNGTTISNTASWSSTDNGGNRTRKHYFGGCRWRWRSRFSRGCCVGSQ